MLEDGREPLLAHRVDAQAEGALEIVAVGDEGTDNFAKTQGGDGEVIAPETQGGETDDKSANRCAEHSKKAIEATAMQVNEPEMVRPILLMPEFELRNEEKRFANKHGGEVSTHRHKAAMAKRELPGHAEDEVQRHCEDDGDDDVVEGDVREGAHQEFGVVEGRSEQGDDGHDREKQAEMDERFLDGWRHALHLLRQGLAENSLGTYQQHNDKDDECGGILILAAAAVGDKRLDQAQEQATGGSAGNIADAADDRGDEGLEAVENTDEGIDDAITDAKDDAGDGCQGTAKNEGEGDDAVDVDAHELGGVVINGDGAHGFAGAGVFDDPHQKGKAGKGGGESEDVIARDAQVEDALKPADGVAEMKLAANDLREGRRGRAERSGRNRW